MNALIVSLITTSIIFLFINCILIFYILKMQKTIHSLQEIASQHEQMFMNVSSYIQRLNEVDNKLSNEIVMIIEQLQESTHSYEKSFFSNPKGSA